MIMHDDERAITSILSRRTPKGEALGSAPMKAESVKDEDGLPDPRLAAAQEAMAAMHEKSPAKFMQAMANFHDLHMAHKESDGDE